VVSSEFYEPDFEDQTSNSQNVKSGVNGALLSSMGQKTFSGGFYSKAVPVAPSKGTAGDGVRVSEDRYEEEIFEEIDYNDRGRDGQLLF
jgi:hypothetical protein